MNFEFETKPLAMKRRAAARMLAIGTTKLDGLIASGQIQAVKSGKNLLVLVASIEQYLASLPPAKLKLPKRRSVGGRRNV
jgi:hypothetical protein